MLNGLENKILKLGDSEWQILKQVNTLVNTTVTWMSDQALWNEIEHWDFPKSVRGHDREDCDGFALQKMKVLIERGIAPGPLTIAVCFTEEGEGHAVLCVSTDRGDLILDSRYPKVKTYDELKAIGYKFIIRSVPGMPLNTPWETIVE